MWLSEAVHKLALSYAITFPGLFISPHTVPLFCLHLHPPPSSPLPFGQTPQPSIRHCSFSFPTTGFIYHPAKPPCPFKNEQPSHHYRCYLPFNNQLISISLFQAQKNPQLFSQPSPTISLHAVGVHHESVGSALHYCSKGKDRCKPQILIICSLRTT